MSEIFREVDEELRRDNWQKVWQRYGKFVIAVAVLIVAATAFNVGWREYGESQRAKSSEAFLTALQLAEADRVPEALSELAVLKEEGTSGYAVLAQFREAALRTEEGETAAASEIYDRIEGDSSADQMLRELATLYSVMLQSATGDPAALIGRLEPISEERRPWRYSARETTSVLHLRTGETAKARDGFAALVDDLNAPRNMRARAAEMLRVIDN